MRLQLWALRACGVWRCCSGNITPVYTHNVIICHNDITPTSCLCSSCKAGLKQRNAAGQTAYDVAVSSGCNALVSMLAARTGRDILGKLGKPKLNLDVF